MLTPYLCRWDCGKGYATATKQHRHERRVHGGVWAAMDSMARRDEILATIRLARVQLFTPPDIGDRVTITSATLGRLERLLTEYMAR